MEYRYAKKEASFRLKNGLNWLCKFMPLLSSKILVHTWASGATLGGLCHTFQCHEVLKNDISENISPVEREANGWYGKSQAYCHEK